MELTIKNLREIYSFCDLGKDEYFPMAIGHGVKYISVFNSERLKESESSISEMLDCLPDDFKKSGGGGWSFLNMCNDKNGIQWSDSHREMDMLVMIGNAAGKLSFLLPKEMWPAFPGKMPYILIHS